MGWPWADLLSSSDESLGAQIVVFDSRECSILRNKVALKYPIDLLTYHFTPVFDMLVLFLLRISTPKCFDLATLYFPLDLLYDQMSGQLKETWALYLFGSSCATAIYYRRFDRNSRLLKSNSRHCRMSINSREIEKKRSQNKIL